MLYDLDDPKDRTEVSTVLDRMTSQAECYIIAADWKPSEKAVTLADNEEARRVLQDLLASLGTKRGCHVCR